MLVLIVCMEIIRTILIVSAQLKSCVFLRDVKSALPNGKLEEEVDVEPQGYVLEGKKDNLPIVESFLWP